MKTIDTPEALHALYGTPVEAALAKVTPGLTRAYRRWIMASRFCILSTVGPEGTDGSPRGDDGPVVQELDPKTLLMPDWRGNNRLDSLRNIVNDGRVSLLFLVPGSASAVRVNGRAALTDDRVLCSRFARDGVLPATVIVIRIHEVYSQCARAILRAGLWRDAEAPDGLPSAGEMIADAKAGFEATSHDAEWPGQATGTMW
ncbi:MAG: pyridoxamine 5'-phosphate oxidase family protein [Rubellimicrobium sp.]|nr:pyridoxamine 5'-phosphate oxidase family protein [Rubellimicrobium sp.]